MELKNGEKLSVDSFFVALTMTKQRFRLTLMKFTAETAAFYAKKSHEPDSARFTPKPANGDKAKPAETIVVPAIDDFRSKVLARTRKQMAMIQKKMEEQLNKDVLDSKVLKELTEAFARLETVEQKLSGRASPGSLRPTSKRDKRQASSPMPMSDPTPEAQ